MKYIHTIAVVLFVTLLPAFLTSPVSATESPAKMRSAEREEKAKREWQKQIAKIPVPKKGCFKAAYPAKQWTEVPCGPPSKYPNTVGGTIGNDVGPQVTPLLISSATGSFDSVTPATITETGAWNGNPNAANAFTIQMNSRFFTTSVCAGHAGCQGWQQFIYSQNQCNGPCVFMEYWLINYGPTCPSGPWIQSGNSCWFNSANTAAPAITAAQLQNTTLTATAQGGTDTVVLTSPGGGATAMAADTVLNLENAWDTVDFIVCGDCCSAQANFSAGTTLIQRITVSDGSNKKPVCSTQASTGETNNLSFGPTAPAASGAGPALVYSESSSGGSLAACAAATSIGDTHLTTFDRTLYDFQAPGDFVLVETPNSDFVVQGRQQSGAPTWPNATVNKAVATRMGKTSVAICLRDTPLSVDGTPTALEDGKSLVLPSGVHLSRSGNVYSVQDKSGNSVRAELNGSYINVSVGLGRWPEEAHGLLLNANGNVNEIEARDGKVLKAPFPFNDLYDHYAKSWAVPQEQSLLDACGERKIEPRLPEKLFFAKDLPPKKYKAARRTCEKAGVRVKSLLDACALDVAVIGSESAAKVYVGTPAPAAIGDADGKRRRGGDDDRNRDKDRDRD